MSILSGRRIAEEVLAGNVRVDPFDAGNVGPNSVDLTLGGELRVYSTSGRLDPADRASLRTVVHRLSGHPQTGRPVWRLDPGELYLGVTREAVGSDEYVPLIEGRSSLGRMGVEVHRTAGFGDVGYKGVWTLEISTLRSVFLYPGMRVCQVFFVTMEGTADLYRGKYAFVPTSRPTPSRIYEDGELTRS